jgi:sugar lactone lactonase YvrE
MSETTKGLDTVTDHRCELGEGPVWDVRTQSICWLDILNGHIHEYSTITRTHKFINVGQMIGSIAITSDGNFIAGLKEGLGFVDRQTGEVSLFHNPEHHLPKNRFNDGKCDPAGRFWAGTMSLTQEKNKGSLYMVEKDGVVTEKISPVSISNGLAWNMKREEFYFIDTPTREIIAFDFENKTGKISNPRVVIRFADDCGYPDGMTIDAEGKLWIAHWDGWQVSRWDPVSGKQLESIRLPVAKVTSCTFGGSGFGDLYITTAKRELKADELLAQPLAGALFVIKNCGHKGLPPVEYKS